MSEVIEKKKAVRKKTALALHRDGECGCSISSNPNNCIYQQFLDGWEFTPDVGNGQKRGEVFTPRFIVAKMLNDVGLFPADAIYQQDYTTVGKEEALSIVLSKVLEPAVGTGNYISTVLWHKLEYAYNASLSDDGELNLPLYHKNVLTAVSSIYVFDIDAGNLETTYRRLLNYKTGSLNDDATIQKWTNVLKNSLAETSQEQTTDENIEAVVKESLNLAEENWGRFVNSSSQGVLQQLYKKHTGVEMPVALVNLCVSILNDNVKLFNGIVKDDTVQEGFVVAGWNNVVWKWWSIEDTAENSSTTDNMVDENSLYAFDLTFEDVFLKDQMISGEIEGLKKKAEQLKTEKKILKEENQEEPADLFAAFDVDEVSDANEIDETVWVDKESEKAYAKLLVQIAKLEKELSHN